MSKRGENIYHRKDGRWEGRIRQSDPCTTKYKSIYGNSYREVKEKLREYRVSLPSPTLPPMTVSQLCEHWLSEHQPLFKPSTYAKYRNAIVNHIEPFFDSCSIHTLTRKDLENFVRYLSLSGRLDHTGGLAFKSVRDIVKLLSSIMRSAQIEGLTTNLLPFEKLTNSKNAPSVDVLSRQERTCLEQYLLSGPSLSKYGCLLSLYTGLRIGELCALKWADIDLTAGLIHIRSTMQRVQRFPQCQAPRTEVICTTPKSLSSRRTIPIPNFFLPILLCLDPHEPTAYFLTGSATHFIEPRTYENHFKHYLSACGLRAVNFHVLRHTFATTCVEVGFDTKSLSEILGHANVSTTMELYVHPTLEHKRTNMNRLAEVCLIQ